MKKTQKLKILISVLMLFQFQIGLAQKVTVLDHKKGKKPNWVTWSRGKMFKQKNSGKNTKLEKGVAYLFKVETQADYPPFDLADVRDLSKLNAKEELALVVLSEFESTIKNTKSTGVQNEETHKQQILDKVQTLKTKASFSGHLKVADYWQLVDNKITKKRQYIVYELYSIKKSRFLELLEKVSDKVDAGTDIPKETVQNIDNDSDNLADIEF